MAFDYQRLRVVVAEQPALDDRYCPECGQALTLREAVPVDPPSAFPLWWTMLAVGLFLVVTSIVRASSDYQIIAHPSQMTHLTGLVNAEDGSAVNQFRTDAIGRLGREVIVGAIGLLVVMVWIGALARRRLTRPRFAQSEVESVIFQVWGATETLFVAVFSIVLLLYGYVLASELVAGQTLTLALMDETVGRTVDVILFTTELTVAGYPRL